MDRNEISGYVQIAVGIVGILLTCVSTPSIVGIFHGVVTPGALPSQLALVVEELKVFGTMLILLSLMGLIFLGVVTTASIFLERRNLAHPLLVSTIVAGALFMAATTSTLALFDNGYWVPAFVAAMGMIVSAWVGLRGGFDSENFSVTAGFFLFAFLGTGFVTLMVENAPPTSSANQNSVSVGNDR